MSAAEKKKTQQIHLKPSQLSATEYRRQHLTVVAAPGQTLEAIQSPHAWAALADKIRTWDRIEVIAEDGSYVAELFVVAVSRQWVQVEVLHFHDLGKAGRIEDDPSAYEAKWRGPVMKWCVTRKSDDSNIADKLESKEDAHKVLIEYEKALKL